VQFRMLDILLLRIRKAVQRLEAAGAIGLQTSCDEFGWSSNENSPMGGLHPPIWMRVPGDRARSQRRWRRYVSCGLEATPAARCVSPLRFAGCA